MYVVERVIRFTAGVIFAASVFAVVGINAAYAQKTEPPTAEAFIANPGQLLQQYPNGGLLLIKAVEQLALADPSTFKLLIGLLPNANDLQRGAIGEGLAQATKVEVLADQTLAADWQEQIAAITDPAFKVAATDAFGDVAIGAVGGTPVGGILGGFGGGPQGSTSTGSAEEIRASPTKTQSFIFPQTTIVGSTPTFTQSTVFGSTPSFSVSP